MRRMIRMPRTELNTTKVTSLSFQFLLNGFIPKRAASGVGNAATNVASHFEIAFTEILEQASESS